MNNAQVLAHIRETNLSYLELARKMIAADREGALVQLGISNEAASMLSAMSPLQLNKVSSGSTLLCSANVTDDLVWGLLTSHGRRDARNDADLRPLSSHESANEALAARLLGRKLQAA